MAKNRKNINDKFYTKESLAIELIEKLNLNEYSLIIEPSAGSGSFYKNINHPNLIGLDIEPECNGILKQNWFDFKIEKTGKILVIGNPPFGNQSSIAFAFIKKAAEVKADTIAFILPKSFKKDSFRNRIPLEYELKYELDLEPNSFTLLNAEYDVPCIFQIWELQSKLRVINVLPKSSKNFEFVKKQDSPDFSMRRVGVNAGKIYNEIEDKSEQSHYFLKAKKERFKNYLSP